MANFWEIIVFSMHNVYWDTLYNARHVDLFVFLIYPTLDSLKLP